MGYQALLFCPDEKNARVVTQVLSELDFAVETASEPFAAVKKLMAQHFDALVVDCENEQNASLLFRSARNSSANQSSLAVAVVEGQVGVAKAFRIGANLVLTKPINVEQSKGTLRVARGLLRKGADPGKGPASQMAPSISEQPVSPPVKPQRPKSSLVPNAPSSRPSMAPVLGSSQEQTGAPEPQPATGLGATQSPALVLRVSKAENYPTLQAYPAQPPSADADASPMRGAEGARKADATAPMLNPPFVSTVSRGEGAAAAAGPARELPSSLLAALDSSSTASVPVREPSFASVYTDDEKETSFGIKKILAVIAAIIVIAVAAYFGHKHGNKDEQDVAPTTSELQPAAAPATSVENSIPYTSSTSKPTTAQPVSQSPAHQNLPASKPSPSKNTSPEPIAEDTTVTLEKVEPMKVKSDVGQPAKPKAAAQPDQPLPPSMPAALGISGSNSDENALSNIVATAPVSVPKPSPEVLNISQGVTQGLVTKRIQPVYPRQALSMRIQGPVQLLATISKDGNIKNVKVLSGEGVLAQAAVDAVRQWKYKPYYLNGDPVEIQTEITVNFKLPN